MKKELEAIIDHLKHLKESGIDNVYLEESTLEQLESVITEIQPVFSESENNLPEPPVINLPPVSDKKFLMNVLHAQILTNKIIQNSINPGCKYVLGDGNLNSPICIVGEAPGSDEEEQGLPFIGRAGKLLRTLLRDVDLDRTNTYITNIMLWRPQTLQNTTTGKGNRPPTQAEINYNLPYFKAQLEIVKPSCIVALGATAISGLIGIDKNRRITKVRGTWSHFNGIPIMQTFHPSYILRNNSNQLKNLFIRDLIEVKKYTKLPIKPNEENLYL